VRIPTIGPYAIIHLGDPHVDDDGTNITVLEQHLLLAQKTEGLYLANVGDSSNNWIGRLARLYADQSTTAAQAWMLVEWMMKLGQGRWVYLIGGNHDAWSGSGDPIQWMAKGINALYQSSEARLELSQPGTKATIRINARHDFSGHSQWNPAHGVMKAAQMGVKDHIMICGHKHTSGYSPIKCPDDDMITHCIQVGSYKVFDRYGREKGFRDQHISPAVLTVIDTTRPANGIVTVFHDIEEGVDFLKFKRRKK
jgi:UDP-2,3-diacylglucosamine pyrophosphatase LpxH